MTLVYHISPSSVTENCTAYAYEPQIDGTLSLVSQIAITAPYPTARTVTFTGLDFVTHKIKMIGDTTSVVYHDFNVTPDKDTVHVFDYIRFVIGDGQSGTPIAGTTAYSNTIMSGLGAAGYTAFENGIGAAFNGIHITDNPAGGFSLLGGATFQTGDQWLIIPKPVVITTPVNDSVVGKQWGATVLNSDMFIDVTSPTSYTPAHLRKLIRLGGVNGIYTFSNASVPPAGYIFRITNFGPYGAATPLPKVIFQNAAVLYGNTTITTISIPLGQAIECVFDGTNWNATFSFPFTQVVPTFYKGGVAAGDVSVDKVVTATFPNQGNSNYFVAVTITSAGDITSDNDVCICIKDKTNTSFVIGLQEVGGAVQNINIEYLIVNFG